MKAEELIIQSLITSSRSLGEESLKLLKKAEKEEKGKGKIVLDAILENIEIASREGLPLCQDTGLLWVWVEIGRDAKVNLKAIENLILSSSKKAFKKGLFRPSMVSDVMGERKNTLTNMPPVIQWSLTEGRDVVLHFLLKGFGSENCSRVVMLNPTVGREGVIEEIVKTVSLSSSAPCPPIFLGIGIGGTMDRAAILSKEAFFISRRESEWEREIKERINKIKIGAGGLGGNNTCLRVYSKEEPTHIAGLPLAITINCWAERKCEVVLMGGYCGEEN